MILTKLKLVENIVREISDNSTGQISPYDVRHNLLDIIDSVHNLTERNDLTSTNFGTPDVRTTRVGQKTIDNLGLQGYNSVDNTAVGYAALSHNYDGEKNTALGSHAMGCSLYGDYNVAVGNHSLAGNVFGSGNVAVGNHALHYNKQGSYNIAIGHSAGYYIDPNSDYNLYVAAHPYQEAEICADPSGLGLKPLLFGDLKNNRLGLGVKELDGYGVLQVAGDVTPSGTDQYKIGHEQRRWKSVHVSDVIDYPDHSNLRFTVSTRTNDDYLPSHTTKDVIYLSSGAYVGIGTTAPSGSQGVLTTKGSIVPLYDNTYDLGFGGVSPLKWRHGFFQNLTVSGTANIEDAIYKTISDCTYECRTLYLASSGLCESENPCGYLSDESLEGGGFVLQSSGTNYRRNYEFTYRSPDSTLTCLEGDSPFTRSTWRSNISMEVAPSGHVKVDRVIGRDNVALNTTNNCFGWFLKKDTDVIRDGVIGRNERQRIEHDADGGTFTLSYGGQTTSAIAYNATASAVESALEALSNISEGDMIVTGGGDTKVWEVQFTGSLAYTNVGMITINSSGLSKGGIAGQGTSWGFLYTGQYNREDGYDTQGYFRLKGSRNVTGGTFDVRLYLNTCPHGAECAPTEDPMDEICIAKDIPYNANIATIAAKIQAAIHAKWPHLNQTSIMPSYGMVANYYKEPSSWTGRDDPGTTLIGDSYWWFRVIPGWTEDLDANRFREGNNVGFQAGDKAGPRRIQWYGQHRGVDLGIIGDNLQRQHRSNWNTVYSIDYSVAGASLGRNGSLTDNSYNWNHQGVESATLAKKRHYCWAWLLRREGNWIPNGIQPPTNTLSFWRNRVAEPAYLNVQMSPEEIKSALEAKWGVSVAVSALHGNNIGPSAEEGHGWYKDGVPFSNSQYYTHPEAMAQCGVRITLLDAANQNDVIAMTPAHSNRGGSEGLGLSQIGVDNTSLASSKTPTSYRATHEGYMFSWLLSKSNIATVPVNAVTYVLHHGSPDISEEVVSRDVVYLAQEHLIKPNPLTPAGTLANVTDVNFVAASGDETDYFVTYSSLESGVDRPLRVGQRLVSRSKNKKLDTTFTPPIEKTHGFTQEYIDEANRLADNGQRKDRYSLNAFDDTSSPISAFTMMRSADPGLIGITDINPGADLILPETIFNIQSTGDAITRVTGGTHDKVSLQLLSGNNNPDEGMELEYLPLSRRVDLSLFKEAEKSIVITMDNDKNYIGIGTVTPNERLTIASGLDGTAILSMEQHPTDFDPIATDNFGKLFVGNKDITGAQFNQSQSIYFMDDAGNKFDLTLNKWDVTDGRVVYTDENENTYIGLYSPDRRDDVVSQGQFRNTTVGHSALNKITTGDDNIAIGVDAGKELTTGKKNVIIGNECGDALVGGDSNIVIGYKALQNSLSTISKSIIIGGDGVGNNLQTNETLIIGGGPDSVMLQATMGPTDAERHIWIPKHRFSVYDGALLDSMSFIHDGSVFGASNGKAAVIEKRDGAGNEFATGGIAFQFTGETTNNLLLLRHHVTPMTETTSYYTPDPERPYAELLGDLKLKGAIRFRDGTSLETAGNVIDAGSGIKSTQLPGQNKTFHLDFENKLEEHDTFSTVTDTNSFLAISTDNLVGKISVADLGQVLESGRPRIFDCGAGGQNHVFTNTTTIDSNSCYNNFFGYKAGNGLSDCDYSNFIGVEAGATGGNNDYSTFIGYRAGFEADSADNSVFIGPNAGSRADGSRMSVMIGNSAGLNAAATRSVGIGDNALEGVTGEKNIEITVGIGGASTDRLINGTKNNKMNIGDCLAGDMATRKLSIGAAHVDPSAILEVAAPATDATARLQEWKNSSGNVVAYLDQNGNLHIDGTVQTF